MGRNLVSNIIIVVLLGALGVFCGYVAYKQGSLSAAFVSGMILGGTPLMILLEITLHKWRKSLEEWGDTIAMLEKTGALLEWTTNRLQDHSHHAPFPKHPFN